MRGKAGILWADASILLPSFLLALFKGDNCWYNADCNDCIFRRRNMRIVIIGGGKLGHSLGQSLVNEGHDITSVDRSESVIQRGMDTLDAMFIKGSGVSAEGRQVWSVSSIPRSKAAMSAASTGASSSAT